MFLKPKPFVVKGTRLQHIFHCSPIRIFVSVRHQQFTSTSMSWNKHSSEVKEKTEEDYGYHYEEDYKKYQNSGHSSSQIDSYINKDWKLRGKEPNWAVAEPVEDRKSIFQGRAIQIGCRQEALELIEYLKTTDKRVKKATHNITGWRVLVPVKGAVSSNSNDSSSKKEEKQSKHSKKKHQSKGKHAQQSGGTDNNNNDLINNGKDLIGKGFQVDQEFDNNGEPPGGERILQLLQLMEITNVLVIVTRWYGGTKLGPDRFKHISTCAQKALEVGGFFSKKSGHHKK